MLGEHGGCTCLAVGMQAAIDRRRRRPSAGEVVGAPWLGAAVRGLGIVGMDGGGVGRGCARRSIAATLHVASPWLFGRGGAGGVPPDLQLQRQHTELRLEVEAGLRWRAEGPGGGHFRQFSGSLWQSTPSWLGPVLLAPNGSPQLVYGAIGLPARCRDA